MEKTLEAGKSGTMQNSVYPLSRCLSVCPSIIYCNNLLNLPAAFLQLLLQTSELSMYQPCSQISSIKLGINRLSKASTYMFSEFGSSKHSSVSMSIVSMSGKKSTTCFTLQGTLLLCAALNSFQ